jgi:glycosyltransferase involved in cell wall biosynthesis
MPGEQFSLLWKGPFFSNNSLTKINHNICKHLLEYNEFNLHISPSDRTEHHELVTSSQKSGDDEAHAQVTVSNQWPTSFGESSSNFMVCFLPLEFSLMPKYWYSLIQGQVNEIWVYSKYNKEVCIKSGISENKIKIIPLGVDEKLYNYEVKPIELEDKSSFRFLFIARPSELETLNALLKAYKQEFSGEEDVSLIIKLIDSDISSDKLMLHDTADTVNPKVLFLEQHLSEQEMAGLYKSCNCLVHPQIGDGFVLPVIEAMACGTPAIVPNFGAAQEFCDTDTAFFLSLKEEASKQVELKNTDTSWWLEVNQTGVQKMMRFVFENRAEVLKRGKKASDKILSTSTWKQTVHVISNNVKELVQRTQDSREAVRKDLYIQLLYGIQLYKTDRFEDAIKIFQRILTEYPHSLEAHYNLAIVYIKTNDYSNAVKHFLSITQIMENQSNDFQASIWNHLGICYMHIQSIPDAVSAFKKAASINPSIRSQEVIFLKKIIQSTASLSPELYRELGDSYYELGNAFLAEDMYMKALEYGDDQYEILESLAEVYKCIHNIKNQTMNNVSNCPKTTLSDLHQTIIWQQLDTYPLEDSLEIVHKRRKRWEIYFNKGNQVLELKWCFNKKADINPIEQLYDGILLIIKENTISAHDFLYIFKSCSKLINPIGKIIILFESPNTIAIQDLFKKIMGKIIYSIGWTIKETSDPNDINSFYIVLQKTKFDVLWQSLLLNSSGYAEEQRHFLDGLRPLPLKIKIHPFDYPHSLEKLSPNMQTYLSSLQNQQIKSPLIHYQAAPVSFFTLPVAPISIARTMFETDSLPKSWVEILNEMTEIWVPSEFNRNTFATAGVDLEKIKIIPGTLDEDMYNPQIANPYKLEKKNSYKFLSVFDWSIRKGWDVLLQAYFEEFSTEDNVSLILKISNINEPATNPYENIRKLTKKMGLKKLPHVQIIQKTLSQEEMVRLYAASDCFVLPSRGEGWGRPYMEAMAMELPTIGTKWSGQQAFMNDDNSYLLNIDGLTFVDPNSMPVTFYGHQWAKPSVDHLKVLMRQVYNNPEEAKQKGLKARKSLFPRFSIQTIGEMVYQRMNELVGKLLR